MVGVRDGDETFVLCACDMRVLAKGGGMFVAAPDADLFTVEVSVVSPGATREAVGAAGVATILLLAREPNLPL
jgi:hypothetical protein